MSNIDNYGGVSHDPAFDGGDTLDWNPCDHVGDIDDAIWSKAFGDPTGWLEATVQALVFEVEVPEHDAEGNATDGSPYVIPQDLVGAKTCFVAGTFFDWGHYCDGMYEHCPKDTTLDDAKMRAEIACDGPLEGADALLISDDEEPWLPGNPEVLIDDSEPDVLAAALRYWREGEIEPYDSEYLGFDANKGPAEILWRYADQMGWLVAPPNATWVMLTKRTEDPKLSYLEGRLKEKDIPSRRNGESFHAPILEVPKGCLDDAWKILDEIIDWQGERARLDDIPDDDPMFV